MSGHDQRNAENRLHATEETGALPTVPVSPSPVSAILSRRDNRSGLNNAAAERVATASPVAIPNGTANQRAVSAARVNYANIEDRIIELAGRWFEPAARISIFVVYFWFGILKALGLSPATPLAQALTSHTIGMQYFNASFKSLAVFEMGVGLLFLIPALTRLSIVLIVIHLGVVSSPLVIVANVAWVHPLVPTLEGQYIIKDLVILALAIGIVAQMRSSGDKPALSTGSNQA